jgi:hypothetical protein
MNFVRALAVAISQLIDSSLVTFLDHYSQWDSEHSLQHSDYWHHRRSTSNETVRPAHLWASISRLPWVCRC